MNQEPNYESLRSLARGTPPVAAIVLGSGMGPTADRIRVSLSLPFAAVPGLNVPTVAGHCGRLLLGEWAGQCVLVFVGRVHRYEGRSWDEVTQPVRIAKELGAPVLLCTNAAGGIRDDLVPGRLMVIRDHLEWTVPDCWKERTRPCPYSTRLCGLLQQAAQAHQLELLEGIYASVSGPCYETPAEIRALRIWGADAVGMSTAAEVHAAFDLGMEAAAVSLITNRAAGLSSASIDHGEVLGCAAAAAERLATLIEEWLHRLGSYP